MSRLILKPVQLLLEGRDPVTGYKVRFDSSSGILKIGCQEHLLTEWKRDARGVVGRALDLTLEPCVLANCDICKGRMAHADRRLKKVLPRLSKLIKNIERAEAGLKKGLRAQTKAQD